jgi:hypothetical protein
MIINWKETRAKTDLAFDIISSMVGVLLGLAMIGQGIYRIYVGMEDGAEALYYIGNSVIILSGIAVVFLGTKDRIRMAGAYALGLGISRFMFRWNEINATDDSRMIFVEVLFMILALNLVRIGFYYIRGKVVSLLSLIVTASLMAGMDIFLIVLDQYTDQLPFVLPFEIDPYFYMMNALMYVALIGLLDTRLIRENTELAKQAKVLDRVRSAYALEKDSYITEEAARCLLDRSGELWRDVDDGTVQSEMTFHIVHDDFTSTAVAQIWKGKDPLYLTVVYEGDSVFNANRLRIDDLRLSEGILYGYGKDGTRFRVLVKEGSEA